MRKILLYTLTTLAAAGMASCEDFLTRDTYDQIGSDEFWKSETDLELYANGFIQKMIPGDGTITRGDIYADYCAVDIPTDLLRPDGNVSPDNQTGWAESNWTNLRRVNYMLDNMHKCKGRVSDEIYNHYEGVARFWRAWFYYDKVQTFGAVPWYDFTIAASDKEAMMKPRDSREYVMDKGPYSLVTGDVKTAYRSLFTSAGLLTQEVIFGREYSKELSAFHETSWYYYSPTYGAKIAMTKKFMNTYLTTRGTPFTDIDGYQTIDFIREFDGRDARMAQTVISPTYKMKISGRERLYSPNWKVTRTGYHPIKWSIDDDADNVLSKAASWNSLPILRYAEVLLNYAEAKAELGEMDAAVWDQTIAQLRSRAGVTPVVPDKADPYMEAYFLNTVTDKWILEVRRERGIELCLEMGLRWDDDMRWHMGDLLTSDNNPWTGIWIGNTGYTYDFTGQSTDDNGDPVPDFYIRPGEDTEHSIAISNTGANQTFSLNAAGNIVWEYKRTWGEKKYLRPIPQTAITRNPNLEQNALWK